MSEGQWLLLLGFAKFALIMCAIAFVGHWIGKVVKGVRNLK